MGPRNSAGDGGRDVSELLKEFKTKFCDCSERTLKLTQELVEARAELLGNAQQLELEREASAQLRAELGERMRETAEAQREACAVAVHLDVVTGSLSPAAITRACRIIQKAPLVTDTKADGGTP